MTELDTIVCYDALALMDGLPAQSVDAIISDPPYNLTNCDFEQDIDWPAFWEISKRILKFTSSVVMTAAQPFTTILIASNLPAFRYEWIWLKPMATGFLNAKLRPMRAHENIVVFSQASATGGSSGQTVKMVYNPQMTGHHRSRHQKRNGKYEGYNVKQRVSNNSGTQRYPRSSIVFDNKEERGLHPTQKPVALYEYLIKTYTNAGAIVLDPFCGSGTTAIAARNTGRHFICGDISAEYVAIAQKRLRDTDPYQSSEVADGVTQLSLFGE